MSPERLAWLRGVVEAADCVTVQVPGTVRGSNNSEWDIRSDVLELLDAHADGFKAGLEAADARTLSTAIRRAVAALERK